MNTQKVRADTGGREGKWVGLIIIAILVFAFFAIPFNQSDSETETVLDHQVLISDVKQENLAMIAELRLAHEEIRDLYLDSISNSNSNFGTESWPTIESLESDWVSPFVKDQSWQRKGQHQWQLVGEGYYLGLPQNAQAAAATLLISVNEQPEIWLSQDRQIQLEHVTSTPDFEKTSLIKAGWRQVVMAAADEHQAH
ncbi:hypothetical protein EK599_20715 [Vibrio sp. T187]|uniref:DUF6162 family protein n=1 Tax=Vibrio TaxID=662 RepID=UPI0010C98318|nr:MULTISPECIES: hypothetical protein [Vibrio]MBW3698108.1 hypothetical protein [Vibrio sp. T187]